MTVSTILNLFTVPTPGSLPRRFCVADPGGAGGKTRKDQENPAFPADIRETAHAVGYEHDGPGYNQ